MNDDDEFEVTVDGYFAIIPEWVIDAEVSDRAFRLYAVLRRFANGELKARPSRARLAKRLRCSLSSVKRALKELQDVGALTVRARWTNPAFTSFTYVKDAGHPVQAANGYMLHNSPKIRGGRSTGDPTPLVMGEPGVGSPVNWEVGPRLNPGVGSPVDHEPKPVEPEIKDLGAPSASRTSESDSKQPKRRATRLPADWAPTGTHRQYCKERGINLEHEAHNFRLHAEENDRRAVVWNAAFSRWLMKARPSRNTTGASETGRLWQD